MDETRRLTDEELLQKFEEGLTTIEHLNKLYDGGYSPIAFSLAVEVNRLLTENSAATRVRAKYKFPTLSEWGDGENLLSVSKLVSMQVGGNPLLLKSVPILSDDTVYLVPFRDWWNRDIIFRSDARIPSAGNRKILSRREFVAMLRNKLGAHQDGELPKLLDEIESAHKVHDLTITRPDGSSYSIKDGTIEVGIGVVPAIMRQISHELLVAYGRTENRKSAGTPPEVGPDTSYQFQIMAQRNSEKPKSR